MSDTPEQWLPSASDQEDDGATYESSRSLLEAHAALEVILSLVANGDKSTEPDVARRIEEIQIAARMALGR